MFKKYRVSFLDFAVVVWAILYIYFLIVALPSLQKISIDELNVFSFLFVLIAGVFLFTVRELKK